MNILFYSRNCVSCANLIQIMKNANLLHNFNMFCVDDHLNDLPPHITTVPTLIVGELKQQFVASDAFKWVESVKFMNQQNMIEMNKKIIMANMIKNAQMMGPHGYTNVEMGGFSDNFAFTDVDHAQAHTFFGYGKEGDNTIFTAPEEKDKLNNREQNRKISEIETKRKEQDKQLMSVMKQNQLDAVIEAEKIKIKDEQLSKSQQLKMNQFNNRK